MGRLREIEERLDNAICEAIDRFRIDYKVRNPAIDIAWHNLLGAKDDCAEGKIGMDELKAIFKVWLDEVKKENASRGIIQAAHA